MKKEEWIVSPEELKKNRERALLREEMQREEKKNKINSICCNSNNINNSRACSITQNE